MVLRQITKLNLDSIPLASFQIKKSAQLNSIAKFCMFFSLIIALLDLLKKMKKIINENDQKIIF